MSDSINVLTSYHSKGTENGVVYIHMVGVFVYTGYIQMCGYIHVFGVGYVGRE